MNSNSKRNAPNRSRTTRLDFFKAPLAAGAAGAMLGAGFGRPVRAGQSRSGPIDEYDPGNVKVAQRVSSNVSDNYLLLLKQIGLRWTDVIFGSNGDLDHMRHTQKRFARFGLTIYAGRHYAYRNLKLQLGQPGRDEYIEQYQSFLRNLGKLGIPVSGHDFHPANTYTTAQVGRRGYTAREFNLNDFREKIEKQRSDREYSAEQIWANYTYFLKTVLPVA